MQLSPSTSTVFFSEVKTMDIPSRSRRVVVRYCCGLILLSVTTSSSYACSLQTSAQQPPTTASARPASTPSATNNNLDQPQGSKPPSTPQAAVTTPQPPPPETPQDAHQAQLAADSAALLQLAQELKAEVDKTNKDTLSVSVIRKATEIEKMARNLKEQMRSK